MRQFEDVWRDIIAICESGIQIRQFKQRKPKKVVEVTSDGLIVINKDEPSGKQFLIQKSWIEDAWRILVRDGKLTTSNIPRPHNKRKSSFIMALFLHLDYVKGKERRLPATIYYERYPEFDGNGQTVTYSKQTYRISREYPDNVFPETSLFDGDEVIEGFHEGKQKMVLHLERDRDQRVIRIAKERFMEKNGRLYCEVCGFDFLETYGELGTGFIEGHHTKPVASLTPHDITLVEDIALVCSNCHRMLHKKVPCLTVSELKNALKGHLKSVVD